MKKPVRIAIAFAALLLSVSPMRADETSKRHKIEEMFTLTHVDRTMDQILQQQEAQAKQMVYGIFPEAAKLPAKDQADIDGLLKRVLNLSRESLAWEKLKPEFVEIYASTYTEDEVDGILAFYRSPVGQSLIAKTPEIISKSQAIALGRMQALQPKLREELENYLKQVKQSNP